MVIGVFDSGIGGLSVHRALTDALPSADFIYLADQAHAPYGQRPPEEIVSLTRDGCMRLFAEGASLVILACNTAAAIALRPLQQHWLPQYRTQLGQPVNVLGLIVPTIEAVTGSNWNEKAATRDTTTKQTIGIFATEATVRSNVFAEEIHKRRPGITVVQEACTNLARLIEANADTEILDDCIAKHVKALTEQMGNRQWQAILGCTHYEIAATTFKKYLPPGIRLIHQPQATAEALVRYLARHPEYLQSSSGRREFISTAADDGLSLRNIWKISTKAQ